MLLRQLEGFVAAAKERSISGAAKQLFLSQPALTSRLHALETELGARLFVRNSRGVELSDIGKAFLPHALRSLEALEEGRSLVLRLRDGLGGTLSIAAAPALSTYVLPPMLKRFRATYPEVGVTVRTGHPDEILSLILDGQVQLGLACDPHDAQLAGVELLRDELVLVAAPDYAATLKVPLAMNDLGKQQVIVFRTSNYYEEIVEEILRGAAVSPSSMMEFDSVEVTKKMVENGLGVAFLPYLAVVDDIQLGRLIVLELAQMKRIPRSVMALWPRSAGPPAGPSAHFVRVALATRGPEGPERLHEETLQRRTAGGPAEHGHLQSGIRI